MQPPAELQKDPPHAAEQACPLEPEVLAIAHPAPGVRENPSRRRILRTGRNASSRVTRARAAARRRSAGRGRSLGQSAAGPSQLRREQRRRRGTAEEDRREALCFRASARSQCVRRSDRDTPVAREEFRPGLERQENVVDGATDEPFQQNGISRDKTAEPLQANSWFGADDSSFAADQIVLESRRRRRRATASQGGAAARRRSSRRNH